MLMAIFTTLLVVAVILVGSEWWWRRHRAHSELSRKFVHITVGSFVAFWPYYLSWDTIRFMSLAFLMGVAMSRYLGVFKAIHSVVRPTWGEVYFAVAVGLVTFMTNKPAIYAAALLQMALADGLAAVVGVRYGKGNTYKIFGAQKSLVGSSTFLIMSYTILLSFSTFSTPVTIPTCLGIALIATFAENLGARGFDNLAVPLLVAGLLRIAA